MEENADKLKLQYLAGGSLIQFPPIFSHDGSFLFVVVDRNVQVFSVSTGHEIRVLEGAKNPLISLEYDLLDEEVLVACSESGEVIRWKWSTGAVHRRFQLKTKGIDKYQTFNLLDLYRNDDSPYAFVTTRSKQEATIQYFFVDSVTGKVLRDISLGLKLKRQKPIVEVKKGKLKYFVIAQGSCLIFVNYVTWEWRKLKNERCTPITTLTTHPKEMAVATGDEVGKIMIWRNFFKINLDVSMTLYHWHHTQVTSLVFTHAGTSLFSGGLEAVLVRWNVKKPEERQFVPRMSSSIAHIALNSDNTNIAVSTADNGIQILGVDFRTKHTLQNFTFPSNDKTGKDKFPIGLRVNPRKNTLVLNGKSGHLQFYSAYTKRMLYNVDIVGQNQICYEREKIIYNTRVTQVALNIDWMATAEVFNDEQYLPEVHLKFWHYNVTNQNYVLRTNVGLHHEGGIRAIEFSNKFHVENLLCATVGCDNIIKIWALVDPNKIYSGTESVWCCIGQTDYKNLPIESIAFSEDGSLLAAGFGNTLCVYKADNLKLLTALVPGGSFDGCLHKARISVPKLNKNGSKNDLSTKRQKIVQLFSKILSTNDETLLKEIKNSVKTRRIQEIQTIDNSQKQLLYKKIRSMNQLNLFQKLLLYQKLGISFQLTEEWHSKMVDYVKANSPSTTKNRSLNQQIRCLNLKSRFKAKYTIDKYVKREQSYDENIASKLAPLLSLLKIDGEPAGPVLTNGVGEKSKELNSRNINIPTMQSLLLIKKILFCSGDFAHLVIACTENRLLIWNLLSLRLQTVLKLSTEQIAIDPKTNLVSVFTTNQELYIFSPSDALTLYFRQNMPCVLGAVWLPRKNPKSQAVFVNWQSRSTLYFLTNESEIMYLADDGETEEENSLTFANPTNGTAVKYTPFGTLAINQMNEKQNNQLDRKAVSIGVHGKTAVKSFLDMSSHTMAPLSLLCNDFLKSVIELNLPSEEKLPKMSKNVTLNGHNESSDEEDYLGKRPPIEKAGITTKPTQNEKLLSEVYLQKIAAETIEIKF